MLEGFVQYKKKDMKKYRLKGWWSGLTLGDIFDKATDLYSRKEALVDGKSRYTFGQLREKVDRLAIALLGQGIQPGDSAMIQLPNWAEFIYTYYALQKIGVIILPLVPRHSYQEISYLCKLIGAKGWVLPWRYRKIEYEPMIRDVKNDNPQLTAVIIAGEEVPSGMMGLEKIISQVNLKDYPPDYLDKFRPKPEDICTILPTGGTTGFPKAVPRTHDSYIQNGEYLARAWELCSRDSVLIMAPVGHNQALVVGVVGGVFSCAKLVLHDSAQPEDFCAVVEKEKITHTPSVPVLISRILNFENLKSYDLSSLRVLYGGAQYSPPEQRRAVKSKLGCQYVEGFGMCEGPLAQTRLFDPEETIEKTIGTPICPYDDFKIMDEEGNVLPPGRDGELVAKGPGVFMGYLKAEAENKKAFTKEGYFRSGDMARMDEKGNFMITGRIKDIIIRGGENISTVEVEEAIVRHPDIEQASAIGMPDKEMGERVCAYIKTKGGKILTLEEVISFLKKNRVSVLNIPERIEHIDVFPLTKAEKIDKKVLREDIKRKLQQEGKID
jgi:2,3-dihydroxybenzoate-AMP ligase/mycobactin salicyl-AMP ligase